MESQFFINIFNFLKQLNQVVDIFKKSATLSAAFLKYWKAVALFCSVADVPSKYILPK